MNNKPTFEIGTWERPGVYGKWGGNPGGTKEKSDRCIAEVFDPSWPVSHQCSRKRGYGPHGLFCKQHAKRYESEES